MPPFTTAAERRASLDAALAAAPAEPWLFVYGAMLGDPPFEPAARATATLSGWTRGFDCLDPLRRGTAGRPGLVLGLAPGGATRGVAFRLPGDASDAWRAALEPVWEQEMLLRIYVPRWLPARVGGRETDALAFTTLAGGPLHAPGWSAQAQAERIAAASGDAGPNADYLFEVSGELRDAGIPDPALDALAADVRRRVE